jgi:hypothetical protein
LLACAFCRSIPGVVGDPEFLRAIETAERFADGECGAEELLGLEYSLADLVLDNRYGYHRRGLPAGLNHALIALIDGSVGWVGSVNQRGVRPLARCIFGNPARSTVLPPLTSISLAQATHSERMLPSGELDRARLAVLADALEEAGAVGKIIEHLRGPGPHVRGCWPLDLCLGLG